MESTEDRLKRDWLQVRDSRADREIWSMSQERRERLYYPALVGVNGPEDLDQPDGNIYAENYEENY